MNNKVSLVVLSLGLSMLSACAAAHLYPVQGPMAAQAPTPVLTAKFKGAFNSGRISVTLPGGEVCTGRWEVVHDPIASKDMSAAWDAVYGQGFYQANVLGAPYAQAEATGNKGTVLNVAMHKPASRRAQQDTPQSIRGVAIDNHGNTYKMVF